MGTFSQKCHLVMRFYLGSKISDDPSVNLNIALAISRKGRKLDGRAKCELLPLSAKQHHSEPRTEQFS